MSAFKGTPGPWEVATSCSWRRILSQDGSGVCVPTIQRSDNHPDLHFPNGGPDGPDARLIAAAPDLLEALIDARKQLEAYEEALNGEDYNSPRINAAIAKAIGEQP